MPQVVLCLEARDRKLENELRRVERERDIPKKLGHSRRQRIAVVYQVVDLLIQAGIGSVVEACQILDVNRTAFYVWRTSDATTFQQNDEKLAPEIRDIFTKHRQLRS